ncbi:competence type IV pilus minor pilin ComGF [Periweissella ghanensis]|uniref:Prepilin-type N-terminal cleavage/methylation domain-containing protein n=2 Tax=Periweissella ghanensis TaxID=467997 RepID=A0ABM8ZAU5_9LACO|nr:competence type IV pilus minor pilin ComGF [Periweissella ghanensis]CAH0418473.1 hypothetical protein WGH24286_00891 [Periweissella ghanensis]
MKNYKRPYNHQPAFTLIEACVGLILVSIIMTILQFALPNLKAQPVLVTPVNLTWQNMISALEESDQSFKWVEIVDDGHTLKLMRKLDASSPEPKEYLLKLTKSTHTLYLSGVAGGYMPIVYHVKKVQFEKRGHRIWMAVEYIDGGTNEAYLAITKKAT